MPSGHHTILRGLKSTTTGESLGRLVIANMPTSNLREALRPPPVRVFQITKPSKIQISTFQDQVTTG
jgi:hypothetical protein